MKSMLISTDNWSVAGEHRRCHTVEVDPNADAYRPFSEEPRGIFTRQLILGDGMDTENIEATYHAGVLSLRIPFAEKAKPRWTEMHTANGLVRPPPSPTGLKFWR